MDTDNQPIGQGMQDTGAQGSGAPVPPTPPAEKEEDKTPANFQLGTLFVDPIKIPIPESELNYDPNYFIKLLAGSISLSREEKKRIVESIPKLKQSQIDELIRIFEEEKQKFSMLSKKHVPQLEKLAKQHYNDWIDLESGYVQEAKAVEEESEADAIRRSLGL